MVSSSELTESMSKNHHWRFFSASLSGGLIALSQASADIPLLESDVLPLLQKNCMECHGGLKQKGRLDLRTLPGILKGGESGPAVVKGKPEESELWLQVHEGEMPKGKKKVTEQERNTLKAWIKAGLPTFAEQQKETGPPPLPLQRRSEPAEVAEAIDQLVEGRLAKEGLKPAPPASDEVFLRRVHLDLTGRIPTVEEARAFLDDTSPDKRAALIDALLESPQFGNHFGRTWRNWICPPELPSDMNGGKQPHTEARELGKWFAKRFNSGDSWDLIVRDLLTANGELKKQPQLIYFGLVGQNAKVTPDGAATSVASLFMGAQLQCARCHDDPYRDWSQQQFWSMAAFFGNVTGDFKKVQEKEAAGRVKIPQDAFHNAEKTIPVSFPNGKSKPKGEQKKNWRKEFTNWLTAKENPFFAKAFANRLWFQLFARGLVNPVDDIRPLNPPSHPLLLDTLTAQFAAADFDLSHLLRCLCNSRTYQRSNNPFSGTERAESQTVRLFGRAPVRNMTSDMLLESLKSAYGDPKLDLRTLAKDDGNANGESAAVGDEYLEFQRKFATNEEDPTDFTHGIPQMLTFLNHPRLLDGSRALDEFLKKNPATTSKQIIQRLYLSTLSRYPTQEEIEQTETYFSNSESLDDARDEVLWTLVNRSEFIFIR